MAAVRPMRFMSCVLRCRASASAKPTATGCGIDRIAKTWAALMERLGYARYGAQGGDWGSAVTTALGALDADHCAGIHITLAMGSRPNPGEQRRRRSAGAERTSALRRLGFRLFNSSPPGRKLSATG
jgi:pimeloyl-ACP methyl ester carboxylesterase